MLGRGKAEEAVRVVSLRERLQSAVGRGKGRGGLGVPTELLQCGRRATPSLRDCGYGWNGAVASEH